MLTYTYTCLTYTNTLTYSNTKEQIKDLWGNQVKTGNGRASLSLSSSLQNDTKKDDDNDTKKDDNNVATENR